jgi:long-chain acyl-CoA synthetase
MNLAQLLARQARVAANRPAIFEGARPWASHAVWAARSAGLAQRLRAAGLEPGDRLLVFMRNHPRYLEILWGAWWAGLVVVPVNAKLHPAEVEWIVGNAEARWAFVTRDIAAKSLSGLARQIDAESAEADVLARARGDLARGTRRRAHARRRRLALLHERDDRPSEGRDADPSQPDDDGADLLQRRRHGDARRRARLRRADVARLRPLYAIPHLMAGARHVVPASGGVDPAELFALGRNLGALSTFAAPTIVKRLVDHAEQAGLTAEDAAVAFKTIVYGGAPMYVADIERALRVMGPRFVQIYGARRNADGRHRAVADGISPTRRTRATASGWARWAWRRHPCRCASPTNRGATCPSARPARCWCAAIR